jgi:hypothetical protein
MPVAEAGSAGLAVGAKAGGAGGTLLNRHTRQLACLATAYVRHALFHVLSNRDKAAAALVGAAVEAPCVQLDV